MQGTGHEAYISAEQYLSPTYPWFSSAHVHQERSQRSGSPPSARPQAPRRRYLEEVELSSTFPPALRIRKSGEYQRHRSRSRAFRTSHFVVAWAATEREHSRLGLTVSRRVGRAHQRNRVKRLVRTWFRNHWREISGSWDLVVIARPGAAALDYATVVAQLEHAGRWLSKRAGGA